MPLVNLSHRSEDDWIGDGIAETVATDLSQRGWSVLGAHLLDEALAGVRTPAPDGLAGVQTPAPDGLAGVQTPAPDGLAGVQTPAPDGLAGVQTRVLAGRAGAAALETLKALGVGSLVGGSFQRLEDRLRITVHIVDVGTGVVQIDATNFSDLDIAWRWASPDGSLDLDALREARPEIGIRNFKATPLMVGGTVYISTPLVQSAAIDAGTGETRWVFNPESYLSDPYPHAMVLSFNSRGLAYWTDGNAERLFYGTNDGYLLAVDAKTGRPVRSFGDDGRVDLMEDIPRAVRGTTDSRGYSWLGVASPPIVAHDVVVTPTIISDLPIAKEAPPGWVKGIDARTGDTKWTFRTVPQGDDFGAESWQNESWRYSGNTNVWSMLSVDDEAGYIYLPTGTPTSDYYGGHRVGDNLFAESLVALDIETG